MNVKMADHRFRHFLFTRHTPQYCVSPNNPPLKRIRHDHLHMSSKDSLGLHPRFNDKGQRWRQEYDG